MAYATEVLNPYYLQQKIMFFSVAHFAGGP
jgi:hypothetical protein